jgi:hypothetical protein
MFTWIREAAPIKLKLSVAFGLLVARRVEHAAPEAVAANGALAGAGQQEF